MDARLNLDGAIDGAMVYRDVGPAIVPASRVDVRSTRLAEESFEALGGRERAGDATLELEGFGLGIDPGQNGRPRGPAAERAVAVAGVEHALEPVADGAAKTTALEDVVHRAAAFHITPRARRPRMPDMGVACPKKR